jgi:hypothetical protein
VNKRKRLSKELKANEAAKNEEAALNKKSEMGGTSYSP